jgi:uncharacterized membrane protein YeaQ/YmgE (transglycosylase-associated protein family)
VYYNNKSPSSSGLQHALSAVCFALFGPFFSSLQVMRSDMKLIFGVANRTKHGKHCVDRGSFWPQFLARRHKMLGGILETNSLIWLIISGGIAGVLAKLIMPGKDPGGIIVTILLGIAGGVLMGTLGKFLGMKGDGAGIVLAVVGAVILLFLYRLITKNSGGTPPAA